ncbi:insulin receptor substrate 1-B isoform X2 [Bombus vosnesenskii]|uniref:Insulin receptor substrate 1 n=2 Tax=Pyrobombus TaxID=144703 RepID=A0A6J3KCZ6_9HYME|nr:insulin receptor substrate 1-B isoform X2 [Bombus impatiens]XP_033349904.1 insulin receptor substrate 1-B isoform X2 [Bombus vosnesenskii]XP_050488521.1 insulin receptor substrate 1-B isoform X3 [Bombus huntii]
MSSSRGLVSPSGGPVVLSGHVKKLKTQKKKFFVLRGEAPGYPACLEYYDSKKKFENRQPPKRSILLNSCFNINRRMDTKHKHVIALYTKDECFCLILESEKELDEWLKAMLLLQSGDVADGEQPRPIFEHVWQVTMQKKGLGERKNIHGPYRLCLTDRTLSLVKIGAKDNSDTIEFPLICIRRCGYMERIFYMEVGRSAVTGGGELWMEAEDNNIANNMHAAIMNSMSNSSSKKDDVGPRERIRSSSATEASKPIGVLQRHAGQRFHNSPLEEHRTHEEQVDQLQEQEQSNQTQSTSSCNTITGANGRDRCDSLPSRARTTSESHPASLLSHPRSTLRPHSMYGKGASYSPPITSMPISPASGACSTDSAGSSLSMDDGGENVLEEGTVSRYGHSLTPDEPVILEENGDDYAPWSTSHSHHKYSPNFKSHSPSQQSSYIEMCSPFGSSPGRSGGYMPMSSGTGYSHSRGSSLVEESNTLPEGYVPMAPVGNNGYVDMDPSHNHNGHFADDLSHGGSSCSVTSGTPSTDLRFSEYHLDKVTSFLPPGEDLQARPARAYSIGSRPEPVNRHRKNRLDITQQEASRVRAFSVGSRSKRPEIGRLANVVTAALPVGCESSSSNKSNSAPLLSSSWGHNSGCSITSERMEDLMELDFTKPNISATFNSPPSSYSQSQSQSHSYSTATDTSSYVDMSPGQPPSSTTAPYVDMSRINKINRNNNNNTITANQNHSHIHVSSSASIHKPVITTLKPVEEAEGPYMRMDGVMEDWSQSDTSPKQIASPMQEECVQSNGPPGATRTAPVDLPRRPPADYVDMSFKSRTSLEQDYMNMNMSSRNNRKPIATRAGSRKEKSRSQPIAIQAGNKPIKTPSFLPLNGSPESESLASTPASPPRATPTGSSATIFPFSLNSPQSPEKSFTHQKDTDKSSELNMTSKRSNDRTMAETTNSRVSTINSISVTEANKTLAKIINDRPSSPTGKDSQVSRVISNNSLTSQDSTLNAITKKFSDLNVSKPRLITASPNTSPTLPGFKPTVEKRASSPKLLDETPTPTPTAMPSPLEKENFVQIDAEILHYASLDLPEVANVAPISSASQEGFNYAEIDFAKLK